MSSASRAMCAGCMDVRSDATAALRLCAAAAAGAARAAAACCARVTACADPAAAAARGSRCLARRRPGAGQWLPTAAATACHAMAPKARALPRCCASHAPASSPCSRAGPVVPCCKSPQARHPRAPCPRRSCPAVPAAAPARRRTDLYAGGPALCAAARVSAGRRDPHTRAAAAARMSHGWQQTACHARAPSPSAQACAKGRSARRTCVWPVGQAAEQNWVAMDNTKGGGLMTGSCDAKHYHTPHTSEVALLIGHLTCNSCFERSGCHVPCRLADFRKPARADERHLPGRHAGWGGEVQSCGATEGGMEQSQVGMPDCDVYARS
eukprot:354318-Chlamydomonas_euryale.AAC.8